MTRSLSARLTSRGWRIAAASGGELVDDDQIAIWVAESGGRIAACRARLADLDEAWSLELEKLLFTFGRGQLGLAETFVAKCLASPTETHCVRAPSSILSRKLLVCSFAMAGEPVVGLRRTRLISRAVFLVAAVVGLATWIAALLRDGQGGRLPADAQTVVAVHPEATNRSGHVFAALKDAPATPILLLGRPNSGRGAVLSFLAGRGLSPAAVARPYDWSSAVASFGAWVASLRDGMRMASLVPVVMPLREQAAQTFRRAVGLASARWWTRRGPRPRTIVLGHCGLADTVPLERAMQREGARTIHWLHGLSAGWIYGGVSSLLVTQCGHDARWHARLGGYGHTVHVPQPRPAMIRPGKASLFVLTNFAHPAHPTWAAHGLRDELALIQVMAKVADLRSIRPDDVVWRPHPVIQNLSDDVRGQLSASVAEAGFRLWPTEDRSFDALLSARNIVSTPSGAAVDLLKRGRLPVIAAPYPIDPEHALALFPFRGSDAVGIASALDTIDPAAFNETWLAVAPGVTPSYAGILEECWRA
jgi:hypothetical protein